MSSLTRLLRLGQRVEFDLANRLVRVSESPTRDRGPNYLNSARYPKRWVRQRDKWDHIDYAEQFMSGVVVGIRYLSNGYATYVDGTGEWHHKESIEAVVVSYDLRRKPVLLIPDDVRRLVA